MSAVERQANGATHLVTGGGSGIGADVVRRLLDRGDGVVLIARSRERAEQMTAQHQGAEVMVADLADPSAVEGLRGLPERLDSVVHSAGAVHLAETAEMPPRRLTEQIHVNLIGPALLTARVVHAVRAARGTHVFVNSTSGLNANPGWSAYAASKFGLRGFADALRGEEAPYGVRVTSVFPSRTATPMQAEVHRQERRTYDPADWIASSTVADAVIAAIDLSRDATMPEVVLRPGPR